MSRHKKRGARKQTVFILVLALLFFRKGDKMHFLLAVIVESPDVNLDEKLKPFSVCGKTPPRDEFRNTWRSVYCPHCGANVEQPKCVYRDDSKRDAEGMRSFDAILVPTHCGQCGRKFDNE